jgi:hypothetical protein
MSFAIVGQNDIRKWSYATRKKMDKFFVFYECNINYILIKYDGKEESISCYSPMGVIKPKPLTMEFFTNAIFKIGISLVQDYKYGEIKKVKIMMDDWKSDIVFDMYKKFIKEKGDTWNVKYISNNVIDFESTIQEKQS